MERPVPGHKLLPGRFCSDVGTGLLGWIAPHIRPGRDRFVGFATPPSSTRR